MVDSEVLTAAPTTRRRRPRTHSRHGRAAAVLLLPFFLLFAVFFIAPVCYAIYQSLFKTEISGALGIGGSHQVFSGIENFRRAFEDSQFTSSLLRILLFAVVEVPVMIVLTVLLALLLDSAAARWPAVFRSAFFAPYGVPGVIASLLWGFLYIPGLSPIVDVLGKIGLHPDFLGKHLTLWSIANLVIWSFAGYNVLVVSAQLKSIPPDLYEAAAIDGASNVKIAWHVKLPLARPAIVLITVFSIIGSLQIFAEPLVLQSIDNNISPAYTPNLSAYTRAFQYNDYNYAAAQSVILAVVALVLSFTFLRLTQRNDAQS